MSAWEQDRLAHGARRDFHQEVREHGPLCDYWLPNGDITSFPTVLSSTPVGERYCAACGEWHEQRGLTEAAGLFGCPRCGIDWDADVVPS